MHKKEILDVLNEIGLVSYVLTKGAGYWCIIPVDYWLMSSWGQWGIKWSTSDEEKEAKFLKLISRYQIPLEDLRGFYFEAEEAVKVRLTPQILADFDNKELYTVFGEWRIEDAVLDSCKGSRRDFESRINAGDKFWKITS